MKNNAKLYIVVREDLHQGQQAVQAIHAMRQFVNDWPEIEYEHFKTSNHLCLLAVQDEKELNKLMMKADGFRYSFFREPDLNESITAVAFEPDCKKMLKSLKTALQ